MSGRPALDALAARAGIVARYHDVRGEPHETSEATRVALLAAMGFDASGEESARRALDELAARERARPLEAVAVEVLGAPAATRLALRLPSTAPARVAFELELRCEDGASARSEGVARVDAHGRLRLRLPLAPPAGAHRLRVRVAGGGLDLEAEQARIVAPARCLSAQERLHGRRVFGLHVNLYSVRSARGFGVGDLSDLGALVELADAWGAAFVALNPLHASRNRGAEVSPYSPVSRLFRNPLYLDVAEVPELAECRAAQERIAALPLDALRRAPRLAYEEAAEAKEGVLRLLHRSFVERERGATPRGRAYAAYVAEQGVALERFATFQALAEHMAAAGFGPDWRRWPRGLVHPDAPDVAAFRAQYAEAIAFHRFAQFELDRQLGAAAGRARLAVGLFGDLAVGTRPDGADPWAFPEVFASGATLGAPPDPFAPDGQDWDLAPLHPLALRAQGFAFWSRLLRSAFAHCGALRIDHVMGLCRAFWVPAGRPAREGAYVRMPERELLLILALESRRSGALAVGEDLGTVPAGLASRLARRGVLSTRVLYFERSGGRFRGAARYPERALVSANTHDLAPLAGWWSGSDLALRRAVGALPDDATLDEERARRDSERRALVRRLRRDGDLEAGAPVDATALARAVTTFLGRTRAVLLGISLDDLVGEEEPVNLPGVAVERHASWRRPLGVPREALSGLRRVATVLAGLPKERLRPH